MAKATSFCARLFSAGGAGGGPCSARICCSCWLHHIFCAPCASARSDASSAPVKYTRGCTPASSGRVTANHWQGAFDAVTHLISVGHRDIGFIGISPEDRLSLRRYRGYAAALEQAGLDVCTEHT